MSQSVRSTASKDSRCTIGASSQTIREADFINLARDVPFLIVHVEVLSTSRGILKRECAVTPPGSSVAAIPDEATTNAIFPSLRTLDNKQLYKYVFPVPPWP
ncbi:hypothetical protein LINPERPRIM_LOCUS9447 [Linum perenne]